MTADRLERRALAMTAVLLVGFAILGWIAAPGPFGVDASVAASVTAAMPLVLTDAFDTLASLPVVAAIGVLAAIVCLATDRRTMAVAFVLGLLGEIPTAIAKAIVDRPRPPGGAEVEAIGSVASYPSGHTVRAVVIAGLLVAAFAWSHRTGIERAVGSAAAVGFVLLVGLARIASGQHWPTDVLGGLLLGGAWLAICVAFARALPGSERALVSRRPPG